MGGMTTPTPAPPTGLAIHKVPTEIAFIDISSHPFGKKSERVGNVGGRAPPGCQIARQR